MLPLETILPFFFASVLLGLAPGPDNLFVLTQSALHGRSSGLTVMLGLCTGLLVHTMAVAFGVAVIFQTSDLAFSALKLAGAGYLLYLAWQIVHAPPARVALQGGKTGLPLPRLYRRGIIMNITNPKVSIFFLAFLPQFADSARGAVPLQLLTLGGIFIVATVLVFGSVALLGGALGDWLNRSARVQRIMHWCTGALFLALALRLATASRG